MKNFRPILGVIIYVLLGSFHFQNTHSRKILSVEFFGSKSHVLTYLPLLEELARKGDEVTLITPSKDVTKQTNIREIFTFDVVDIFYKDNQINLFTMKETGQELNPFTIMANIIPKYCRDIYDRPEIQALFKEQFDLVLFQPLFNDCALGFIHQIIKPKNGSVSTPRVLFTPTSAPNYLVEILGGHHPSSFVSNTFINFGDDMTLYERFLNLGTNVIFHVIHSLYYLPVMERIHREKVGEDVPSAKEILRHASIVLSNGHFAISRPKPNLPDVIDVGGIHSRPAQPLPLDIEEFISKGGEHGFILFSFGSALRSDKMPDEKRAIFLSVFSKLQQQVIWKYESDNIPNLPRNILLSKWLPQQDLLGDSRIRMFIMHCGGGGLEEAIYHSTPILGIPFAGDQTLNAKVGENRGILLRLDWNDLTEASLTNAINEILNNSKYRDNVERLSRVFRDQIDSPLDRGIFWLEYVMRHDGAPDLRSPSRDLSQFQYHSLDVIAIYLAIISSIIFLFVKIIKIFWGWVGFGIMTMPKQKTS